MGYGFNVDQSFNPTSQTPLAFSKLGFSSNFMIDIFIPGLNILVVEIIYAIVKLLKSRLFK